jgi:Excisionase from transposon Tn916.
MRTNEVPIWEKYMLSIEEAAAYFHIGENKLRRLADEHKDAGWIFMNGQRLLIKREKLEKVLNDIDTI